MAYKVIQVGTGGHGATWCQRFLPPNIKDGLIEVVAAVDMSEDALMHAKNTLGLRDDQLYKDMEKAFQEVKADFCTIVVPPSVHEKVVDLAIAHDMHILSEKPIADSLEASIRIVEKIRKSGLKMGVTMSHRFDQDKTTLREQIRSGAYGELDYLISRFTMDMRKFGDWGAHFRHTMEDPLIIEGAVHHLDILADMAGDVCETIYAQTWNPRWGEYGGDSQALITMKMRNGVKAFYEGAKTNAVGLNGWSQEYIRAECEGATLIMNRREIEKFPHDPDRGVVQVVEGEGEPVPLIEQDKWSNTWLIEQFVQWLDGGPPMETNVEDNLQSMALVFGAIESGRTGQVIHVQQFLEEARQKVLSQGLN